MWTCHMYLRAAKCVTEQHMSAQDVATGKASETLFALLAHMRATSQVWSLNHMVRFFTSVVLATVYFYYAKDQSVFSAASVFLRVWDYAIASSYYLSVFLTAAFPGYVATRFMGKVQRKLARIAIEDVAVGANVKDTPGKLMHRLADTAPHTGMHFAGTPMTVGKATSFGAIIFWCSTKEFSLFAT